MGDHGDGDDGQRRRGPVFAQIRQHRLVGVVDNVRRAEEALAGRSQRNFAPAAVEKADPQFCLQRDDLLGERRLGNEKILGRLREAAGLGNGQKELKLAYLHGSPLFYSTLEYMVAQFELLGSYRVCMLEAPA